MLFSQTIRIDTPLPKKDDAVNAGRIGGVERESRRPESMLASESRRSLSVRVFCDETSRPAVGDKGCGL